MFIAFEGVDGSGKTTAVESFCKWLDSSRETHVVRTREPGGTPMAEALREFTFNTPMSAFSEACLMFAARSNHMQHVVERALASGHTVVSDRFIGSSYVYQFCNRLNRPSMQLFKSFVEQLTEETGRGSHLVDLQLILDVDFKTASRRLDGRGDKNRFDFTTEAVFDLRRDAYTQLLSGRISTYAKRTVLIDATGTAAQVLAQCQEAYLSAVNF